MDLSRLPEAMRRRAEERNGRSPLQVVTDLVSAYLSHADGFDEVMGEIQSTAAHNVGYVRSEIAAIEKVLAEPQSPGTLANLIAWEGNWVLADPSDAGAATFLSELAEHMRAVVAEVEASRRS